MNGISANPRQKQAGECIVQPIQHTVRHLVQKASNSAGEFREPDLEFPDELHSLQAGSSNWQNVNYCQLESAGSRLGQASYLPGCLRRLSIKDGGASAAPARV